MINIANAIHNQRIIISTIISSLSVNINPKFPNFREDTPAKPLQTNTKRKSLSKSSSEFSSGLEPRKKKKKKSDESSITN